MIGIALALLRSPIVWGAIAGIAMIGGIWWLAESRYAAGADAGRAEILAQWSAASLKAERDKREAERRLEEAAAAVARTHQAEIDQAKAHAQEMIDAYLADLAARPADDRCALTDDDVRRLRDIRTGRRPAP